MLPGLELEKRVDTTLTSVREPADASSCEVIELKD